MVQRSNTMYLTEKTRRKEVLSVTFASQTCMTALHRAFLSLKALFIGTLWLFLWFLARNIASFFITFPSHLRHKCRKCDAMIPSDAAFEVKVYTGCYPKCLIVKYLLIVAT